MRRDVAACSLVATAILLGCSGGGSAPSEGGSTSVPAQAPADTSQTPNRTAFTDATAASGIAFRIGYREPPWGDNNDELAALSATSGVAAGDYDGDGDIDLFIVRGDIGANLLYRNNGSGVFSDVARDAGLAFTATASENYRQTGPTFADMDGDGDLDLFVGGMYGDPSQIFRNDGDGSFSDVTTGSGIDLLNARFNVSAAFGDYDLDGDVDLLLAHWGTVRSGGANPGDTETLWRNDSSNGVISFTSVSEAAGLSPGILPLYDPDFGGNLTDWSFTPTFARIDNDLYPDLLMVADFGTTRFFHNNGDSTFTNSTDSAVLSDLNGMGSAVGDFDMDGDLDWFVSAILRPDLPDSGNRLYRNDDGVFSDQTTSFGVREGGWGWGACFMDFENDGDLDIYHTNGWSREDLFALDESRAFIGSGGGPFANDALKLGLNDSHDGRGIVCADFDDDGDVDILQLHRGSPVAAAYWRNDSSGNNYLKVRLVGPAPNTEAAGARIYVRLGAETQMREIMIGSNYASQNPTIQVFGLGAETQADEVRIQWPDGQETIESAVAAGQTLVMNHPDL
jgi:hypothetical protein